MRNWEYFREHAFYSRIKGNERSDLISILLYTCMSIQGANIGVTNNWSVSSNCPNAWGCNTSECPDFVIKRHDTKPPFKVAVEDCDGPFDLTDTTLITEVSMWAKGKLRKAIDEDDTYFRLADNIGFDQIMVGDIIVMDQVRAPEHMLVTNFDEANYYVQVQRGYNGTLSRGWPKGNGMKIFRVMNATAEYETVYNDILQADGTTLEDQLMQSFLVYEWTDNDTCLPGCYLLEFKLLKVASSESLRVSTQSSNPTPSWTPSGIDYGCSQGLGIEWVRRFPVDKEGFLIQVTDSPTMEM